MAAQSGHVYTASIGLAATIKPAQRPAKQIFHNGIGIEFLPLRYSATHVRLKITTENSAADKVVVQGITTCRKAVGLKTSDAKNSTAATRTLTLREANLQKQ
jgi:hypothetical protein